MPIIFFVATDAVQWQFCAVAADWRHKSMPWHDLRSRCAPPSLPSSQSWMTESAVSGADAPSSTRFLGAAAKGPPMVRFTMNAFPESARLKNESGLPWGAVISPWSACMWQHDANDGLLGDSGMSRHIFRTREIDAHDIARCRSCGGFINSSCMLQRRNWHCSLCGEWNELERTRYARKGGRGSYPELSTSWGEFLVSKGIPRHDIIAHVILVDITPPEPNDHYLAAVRRGLLKAVNRLPDNTWLSLIGVDSSALSFCDLASTKPHILRTAIVADSLQSCVTGEDVPTLVPIVDLIQMRQFAVRVGDCRDSILNTITALLSSREGDRSGESMQHRDEIRSVHNSPQFKRAKIDVGLMAILEFLSRQVPLPADARVGDPSLGQTIVAARVSLVALGNSTRNPNDQQYLQLPQDIVELAALSGICIDVYTTEAVVSSSNFAATFSPIVCKSGGRFRMCVSCECIEEDLTRNIGVEYAAAGVLSIRTSGGYKTIERDDPDTSTWDRGMLINSDPGETSSFHGEGGEGMKFIGLHLSGCDASTSVAFSFETSCDGVASHSLSTTSDLSRPVLQICYEFFQQEDDHVVKRLRVLTVMIPVARNVHSLMVHADPSAVFLVICRKILRMATKTAVGKQMDKESASNMLFDWITNLARQCHVYSVREASVGSGRGPGAIHLFRYTRETRHLVKLVQLVYGFLRSDVLNFTGSTTIARCVLLGSLSCAELERAVYPMVSVFDSAGRLVGSDKMPRNADVGINGFHPLSMREYEKLYSNGLTILVDSFDKITVLVSSEGIRGVSSDSSHATTVDPESPLFAQLQRRKATASQCPSVGWHFSIVLRAFQSLFIDDCHPSNNGLEQDGEGLSFLRFVATLKDRVDQSLDS